MLYRSTKPKDRQENFQIHLITIMKTLLKVPMLLTNIENIKNGNQLQLFKETSTNSQPMLKN